MIRGSPWTEERDALALRLWAGGMSGTTIARKLGLSRSAVIAHIMRRQKQVGLIVRVATARKRPGSNVNRHRLRAARRAARRVAQIVQPPAPETTSTAYGKPCGLIELTEQSCRWPIGEGPYQFCNAERVCHEPYCERHLAAAWRM